MISSHEKDQEDIKVEQSHKENGVDNTPAWGSNYLLIMLFYLTELLRMSRASNEKPVVSSSELRIDSPTRYAHPIYVYQNSHWIYVALASLHLISMNLRLLNVIPLLRRHTRDFPTSGEHNINSSLQFVQKACIRRAEMLSWSNMSGPGLPTYSGIVDTTVRLNEG